MSIDSRRGFTLIEALVSVFLLSVGIVASMQALASVSRTEVKARDQERMQRLAVEKYNELVATDDAARTSTNGDFQDRNDSVHLWDATYETSGVENLDVLSVVVTDKNQRNGPSGRAQGLVYIQPQQTTANNGTATGTAGGGGGR